MKDRMAPALEEILPLTRRADPFFDLLITLIGKDFTPWIDVAEWN